MRTQLVFLFFKLIISKNNMGLYQRFLSDDMPILGLDYSIQYHTPGSCSLNDLYDRVMDKCDEEILLGDDDVDVDEADIELLIVQYGYHRMSNHLELFVDFVNDVVVLFKAVENIMTNMHLYGEATCDVLESRINHLAEVYETLTEGVPFHELNAAGALFKVCAEQCWLLKTGRPLRASGTSLYKLLFPTVAFIISGVVGLTWAVHTPEMFQKMDHWPSHLPHDPEVVQETTVLAAVDMSFHRIWTTLVHGSF